MKKLTVCGADIAQYTIVLPDTPEQAEETAAEFLKRVIDASCGVTLPVSHKMTAHSIVLGSREHDPRIKWDGFRTATDENHLYLHGNIPRGTLYAAYNFAEKYLGYRYFADDLEVIPTDGITDVPVGTDTVDNPVYEMRRHSWIGNSETPAFGSFNRITDVMDEKYGRGIRNAGCHTFNKYCPDHVYYDEHPEYFSLYYPDGKENGNGVRLRFTNDAKLMGGQLCLTNPDVLRIVTENLLKDLRAHPDWQIIDFSQNDNTRYCQCDRCAAVDEEEGTHAGTMIRFINAVAEEIEKEFPNVLVQTFAYQYTRKAPKITKTRHNVLIRYCTIEACFRHPLTDETCTKNGSIFSDELREWKDKCHQISIWDYSVNYSCFAAPFPNLYALRENIRFFADCGATHVYEEDTSPGSNRAGGAYPELKAYLISKLLWNPYMDDETYNRHMEEFLCAYYGKGWREIKAYIDMEHELTADRHFGCFERVDTCALHQCEDGARWNEIAESFVPKAYQEPHPNSPLSKLVDRLDEAEAFFDRAYALTETEEQRKHITRNKMAFDYLRLFCTPHDKASMTEEEQKTYEAAVQDYLRKRTEYGFYHNLFTARRKH